MSPFDRMKLKVEHLEAWRFLVPSETDGEDPYLVDLEEFDGNGRCGCPHFQMRLEPVLIRGINDGFARCKHIRIALDAVLNPEDLRDLVMASLLRTGKATLEIRASQPFKIPTPKPPRVPAGYQTTIA